MLKRQSGHIRACHDRAEEARCKAQEITDPALKAELFDMERRWLLLARSYEFSESLSDFTAENSVRQREADEHLRASALVDDGRTDDGRLLHEISTSLIQEDNLDSLYARIMDAAIGLMSSDMASMQFLHPERNELQLLCQKGFHPDSTVFWQWVRLDSESTCGMALAAGCRIVVPDVEDCASMAGTLDLEEYRRSNIRAVQSTPLMSRSGKLLGMISTHWRAPHRPTDRALRQLDVLGRQAADLIERGMIESALRDSEERSRWLASIIESSDDAIISKDFEGIIKSWNRGSERVFGYAAEEAIGRSVTMIIPADRRDEERAILERVRRGERIENYQTVRQRRHGSLIVVSLTISPVNDARGKIVGASMIARDITEQKRVSDQIDMLAREAEHRTKNVLTTVQATVKLSHADTADDLKRAIDGRIQALANVHALFVESRWAGAELGSLVRQELSPYRDAGARVQIEGPQLLLEPTTAQAIAVALHELATNAAKYGALSVEQGQVAIKWSATKDGRLVLNWIERGGPGAKPPTHRGFGTTVIERSIRGQAGGKTRLDWRPEGLVCEIEVRI